MSEFTYLNDDILQDFQNGSASLIEHIESYEETPETELVTAEVFQELITAFEEDKIDQKQFIDFLSASIKNDNIARIFCQVLNSFDSDEKFTSLLNVLLLKTNTLKAETLAKYMSGDFIKAANVVTPAAFTRRINNVVRSEFLTQKKYNLIYEEIVGYSKFVTELYYLYKYEDSGDQVDYILQVIEKLIGHYNLDPNRCLELLLEVYTDVIVTSCRSCLDLLRKSRWWPIENGNISSISSLSEGGSETAAKLIGLRLMKTPEGKDQPETYRSLIAILIKEGFISFGSIYKYLRPNEEEMKLLETEYNHQLNEEVSKAGANALALAAPLADDEEDGKPRKREVESKTVTPKSMKEMIQCNQIYQFLRIFLSNGLYWPSIFILTNYPFLSKVDTEIPILLSRLFDAMIGPLYNQSQNFSNIEMAKLSIPQKPAFGLHGNDVKFEEVEVLEILTFKPIIAEFGRKKYTYFYREWNEKIPLIDDFAALKQISIEFLHFVGVELSKNILLFQKIIECVYHHLEQHPEKKNEVFNYFRNFIFPVLPLIEENSIVVDKAYQILAVYSLEERFSLYGELYNNLRKNNPLIQMAYSKAEKSTKDVLKRLSKENVGPMMRRLAKISFSNPLPCFLTMLQQIESYDNLISLVVETARYFNDYGWDNLTAAILIRLSSSRSSTQHHGMIERQWIQSLANFVGKICQRYPKRIDIKTILKFLIKGFDTGDNIGVLVLREMLSSMGGIQSITNLTIHQIDMINSGSSLQKIIYRNIDDMRYERTISGSHLLNSFVELDSIDEILVSLCKIANNLIFDSEENHLKILSSRSDDLSSVIRLFTTLVSFFKDENNRMDSIKDLQEQGVPLTWGFELWRKFINDTKEIEHLKPKEIASGSLFAYFWKLNLHDINYSESLYDTEIEKLESNIRSLKETISINTRKRSDVPLERIDQMRDQLAQNEAFLKQLPDEKILHKEENENIDSQLKEISTSLFEHTDFDKFVQYCVLPRAIHSSFDAVFVSRFLFKLHKLEIEHYSVISVLDCLIKSRVLFGYLYSSTSTEAENLGLLIADILRTLQHWINEEFIDDKIPDLDGLKILVNDYHSIILEEIELSFKSDEYMSRSTTITFAKNLLIVYPIVDNHCDKLAKLVEKISQTETREDLKLSSSALLGQIKLRAKESKPIWEVIPMSEEDKIAIIQEKERLIKREQAYKKALAEKELEAKKLKEEQLAREKKEKEEQLAKEKKEKEEQLATKRKQKEEEELKKRAASNLYSSTSVTGSRSDPRTNASASSKLGRYDNYASPAPKLELPSGPSKEATPGLRQKISQRVMDLKQKDEKENIIIEKEKTPDTASSPTPTVAANIKNRKPLKPQDEIVKTSRETQRETPRVEEVKDQQPSLKRAPLPPQNVIMNEVSTSKDKPRFGNDNKPSHRKSFDNPNRMSIPPPPPPPTSNNSRPNSNGFRNSSFGNQTYSSNYNNTHDMKGRMSRPTFDNRLGKNYDSNQNPNKRKGDFQRNYDHKRSRH